MLRPTAYACVFVLSPAITGCASSARLRVEQPGFQGLQRTLNLTSRWAVFSTDPSVGRYIVSFPLPGAVSGDEQYHLYLRTGGDLGRFAAGKSEPQVGRFTGFFIQVKGVGAGLTQIISGTVSVKSVPFGGRNKRRIEVQAACDDSTAFTGSFLARRDPFALERFESRYAADVRALSGEAKPPK